MIECLVDIGREGGKGAKKKNRTFDSYYDGEITLLRNDLFTFHPLTPHCALTNGIDLPTCSSSQCLAHSVNGLNDVI